MASPNRVMDLLHTPVTMHPGSRRFTPLSAMRGEIMLEDITFGLPEPPARGAAPDPEGTSWANHCHRRLYRVWQKHPGEAAAAAVRAKFRAALLLDGIDIRET